MINSCALSSAVEHFVYTEGVVGPNPTARTMTERKTLGRFQHTEKKPFGPEDPTAETIGDHNLFFRDSPAFYNLSSLIGTLDFGSQWGNHLYVGRKTVGFLEVTEEIQKVLDEYCEGNKSPDIQRVPQQLHAALRECLKDIDTLTPRELQEMRKPKTSF